jgi:probable HAF family extracellular repeat protein
MHAFLWSSGIMTDLGTLARTNGSSHAYGINDNGQVVGCSSTTNGDDAFIYSGGKMTDLNNLIPANPGWTLTQANAINDSGQIVGFGFNPSGQTHAFLLTPVPVPHRATASAVVSNGVVVNITITDRGFGYTNPPTVFIQGGGGTGATATAVVSNGVVVGITITDAGIGYTGTPSIYIYSPFGLQVGLIRAVTTSFSDLLVGTNYQLQVSGDLNTWTNQGPVFTATNPASIYPQYWNVDSWSQLFFRLRVSP